jgi:peptide-methionine (R)-S-oxide reductase
MKEISPDAKLKIYDAGSKTFTQVSPVLKSEDAWRRHLTAEQFRVARKHGTEHAFSHEYYQNKSKGVYRCVACGTDLFSSEHKFDSGTGWPSFWQPIAPENVASRTDESFFMVRTEVHCPRCLSHLGHVFEDGPDPTGLRYCINGVCLNFIENSK